MDDWAREVKVFVYVMPRDAVDRTAFAHAWGQLRTPAVDGLRRYVHTIPFDHGGDAARWCFGAPHPGTIAELWLDSVDAWIAQLPALHDHLRSELGDLADVPATRWLATRERPVVAGPELDHDAPWVKASFQITRKPGMPLAAFRRHWCTTHAEIVGCTPGTPKLLRYVQCHALPELYAEPEGRSPRKRHAGAAPYDGVAELWWRDTADLDEALASPAFQRHQPDDVARFVDGMSNFGVVSREDRRVWP